MLCIDVLTDSYAPLRGIEPRTVTLYGYTLRAWGEFLGRQPTLDDLADELSIAKFLTHRLSVRSVGTAAKDRAQIRALAEFCYRRGLISKWPTIRTIRVPDRVPQAWLADEFRRLLAACDEEPGEVGGVPSRLFWRAMLLTAIEVGERIGGLLSIEWRDVSPAGILIRAESRKGKRRDLFRSISPECLTAIETIRTDRKLVFDWDRCYTSLWGRLGKICKRAGLPNDRLSKFHRIRKTTASYSAAAGLNAQAVMDHASPLTTNRYLDPRIVTPTDVYKALPKVS